MNKKMKLAMMATSLVMAGTMAFSFVGCGGGSNDDDDNGGGGLDVGSGEYEEISLDEVGLNGKSVVAMSDDGTLEYKSYTEKRSKQTLNMAVGHNNTITSTSFQAVTVGTITLPDGKSYGSGDLKPAWAQMGKDLNITFNDVFLGKDTKTNLAEMIKLNTDTTNAKAYANVDVFTSDLDKIVAEVSKPSGGERVLNLGKYLSLMPNFKKFLADNPVVYLSLLQEGMDTETGEGSELYVAPYFDGNDDIERYCLVRKDWVEKILKGDGQITGDDATAAATTYVTPEFTTAYTVESLNKGGTAKQWIKKDYAAAKSALTSGSGALATAYNAIAGSGKAAEYNGNGNIVDIMNSAIAVSSANATAANLATLYRAYIDVCYKKDASKGGAYSSAAYEAADRANLFNGYDAAWDADDLVAIMRIAKLAPNTLLGNKNGSVQGIVPRTTDNDRTPDVLRLFSQLYGVRGMDSRFENTYVDEAGVLHDTRIEQKLYDVMDIAHTYYQEGLISTSYHYKGNGYTGAVNKTGENEGFIMYDYVQTQTGTYGFYPEIDWTKTATSTDNLDTATDAVKAWAQNYNLGAVLTPVAKWDVNGNGSVDDGEIMRFTESWRATKTGGVALNGRLEDAGNEGKLLAALQFIDYLYSADGQIVSTYGPQATNAGGDGGFWYNEKATDAQIAAGQYFSYKGVKYHGTDYKGNSRPTITQALYKSFMGERTKEPASQTDPVASVNLAASGSAARGRRSFTNYARMLIGSTLPIAVKDQAFEYQCTAGIGKESSYIVGVALANDIIKHVTPNIKVVGDKLKAVVTVNESVGSAAKVKKELSSWYICVPTSLPISDQDMQDFVTESAANKQKDFKQLTGDRGTVGKTDYYSIYHLIIVSGYTVDYNITGGSSLTLTNSTYNSASKLCNALKVEFKGENRNGAQNRGWQTATVYAIYLFGNK